MKILLSAILLSFAAFAQPPIVSNVRHDYVPAPDGSAPHSIQRILWNVNSQACYHKINYWPSNSATVSTSGTAVTWVSGQQFTTLTGGQSIIINSTTYPISSVGSLTSLTLSTSAGTQTAVSASFVYVVAIQGVGCSTNDLGTSLSGLAPNTTYFFQPQSSFDNSTWSTTGGINSFTTAALPLVHPAPPQLPAGSQWAPPAVNTSGYNVVNMNSSCVDSATGNSLALTAKNAVILQPSNGTVINIPAGTICSGGTGSYPYFPNDTQYMTVPSSGVNTSTGVFTPTALVSGWTLTNGQTVTLVGNSCLPGSLSEGNGGGNTYNPSVNCQTQGPLLPNTIYYIVGVIGATFQLAATLGGSPIITSDQGQSMLVEQWPRMNSNWIVFQTTTPDSQFCPPGVRCMGSIWQPKMAQIQGLGGILNFGLVNPWISESTSTGFFTHNVLFRGIEWTFSDTTSLANVTVDPQISDRLWFAPGNWGTSYIVFDRNYIHVPPFPNRAYTVMTDMGGFYTAIENSDLENFNLWYPSTTPTYLQNGGNTGPGQGLQPTLTGQTLTIIPGSSILGTLNECTSTANITFTSTSGSTSGGTAYVYVDPNCVATVNAPTGTTGTVTGSMVDKNSVSHSAVLVTSASPSYNVVGGSGYNCLTLGTLNVNSSGAFTSFSSNIGATAWDGQGSGTQGIIWEMGPGPFSFLNNYMEFTGLAAHMNDGSIIDPIGFWYRRNTFNVLQTYKMGSAISNGFEYQLRNGPECKHCRQGLFEGNLMVGNWASIDLSSPFVLFHTGTNTGTAGTPPGGVGGYTVQDILIRHNTCWVCAGSFELGSNSANITPNQGAARIEVFNNLLNSNGYTQTDGNGGCASFLGCDGNSLEIDHQIEDLIVKNNTLFDTRGTNPSIFHAQVMGIEGCDFENNFFWFNESTQGMNAEIATWYSQYPPILNTGSTLFNSMCTSDPNVPSGILTHNLVVPYYSNSGPGTPSGLVSPPNICSNFGGASASPCTGGYFAGQILTGSTAVANLATVGMQAPGQLNTLLLLNSLGALGAKLLYTAPCVSGGHCTTDGSDMGVNIPALLEGQGAVNPPTVGNITSTGAIVNWFAYDGSFACYVDYATSPNDPSAQTGGGRVQALTDNSQSVTLSGLSASTTYNYRVLCPVNQPTGSFTTQ